MLPPTLQSVYNHPQVSLQLSINYNSMQIKNSFDYITIRKITKGAFIAMSGAAALAGLQFIAKIEWSTVCTEKSAWLCNGLVAPFVAFIVPTAVNAVKEYTKGK